MKNSRDYSIGVLDNKAVITTENREAIFWKYINHDFERAEAIENLKYKTLSYQEIAKKWE